MQKLVRYRNPMVPINPSFLTLCSTNPSFLGYPKKHSSMPSVAIPFSTKYPTKVCRVPYSYRVLKERRRGKGVGWFCSQVVKCSSLANAADGFIKHNQKYYVKGSEIVNEKYNVKDGEKDCVKCSEKGSEKDGEKGSEKDGEKDCVKDGEKGSEKDGEKGSEKDGEKGSEKCSVKCSEKDGEKGSEKEKRVMRRGEERGMNVNVNVSGDLLAIPGVGPRNLRKLVDNGIVQVAHLKQLYKDKSDGMGARNLRKLVDNAIAQVAHLKQLCKDKTQCFVVDTGIGAEEFEQVSVDHLQLLFRDKFCGKSNDSSQKMVEFLQSSVGIIHKNHAESITTYIKESVDKELKDDNSNSDSLLNSKKRLTFCVEGNISVGKSTFLQRIANETLELQDIVEIVPEPVGKWQDVGKDHFNILDAFYAEPERYAYTFQNYVFVTRLMQERESSAGTKPLRLMERSVFSDRMVFVRAVHEAKWMSEMEISIYDSWFDPVVSSLPGLIPDAFIYLRASPDTCHKRMLSRKRSEEDGVSLDYLRGLHEKHESWLFPSQTGSHGVLSVSGLADQMDRPSHPGIRDRVFYLEGNHMHPSIQKVPALVLDCEPNIDFTRDIEAKQEYAKQVAEFFDFVKKKKEETDDKASKDAERKRSPHVLLPHAGGLWVPGGNNFPQTALKSLEFPRTMSYMSG